jgi:hypothetical protein
MSEDIETPTHPWEPRPGSAAAALFETTGRLYRRIGRLEGGLHVNDAEFDLLAHMIQGVAVEEVVAATPKADLFNEHELATLHEIDAVADEAAAMTTDDAALLCIRFARLGLRSFVFQAARQRTGAPGTSRWFWGPTLPS